MQLSDQHPLRRLIRRSRREGDEAGVTLVIFAVALVGLMAFSALAIDLGNISQTKGHSETAVQDAVLSAVPNLAPLYVGNPAIPPPSPVLHESTAANVAEQYLIDNYSSLTTGDFTSATACAGLLPTTIYFLSAGLDPLFPNGSDCFGFFDPADPANLALDATNPTGMAVAIPTQYVNYTLGRASGLTKQAVASVAYASVQTADSNYGLPFGYVTGGASGLQCLKTGSGRSAANCTGFTTGSGTFGVLDSPRYTIYPGTNTSSGANNLVIETDIALGIDHHLTCLSSSTCTSNPAPEICDANLGPPNCPSYNNVSPYDNANWAAVMTGVTINGLAPSLFQGGFTSPDTTCAFTPQLARLAHPDGFVATGNCATDNNSAAAAGPTGPFLNPSYPTPGDVPSGSATSLNGVHISKYLDANGLAVTSACTPPAGGASKVAIDAMSGGTYEWATYDTCLSSIITLGVSGPIFSASIEQSPRFGIVPLLAPGSGSGINARQVTGFEGVYLDLAYISSSKKDVTALLAWVFPLNMIESTSSSGLGSLDYKGGPWIADLCSFSAGNC